MRLRRLEPVLRRALRGPCRPPEGGRLLVAVSGGADSLALLIALSSLSREFGLALVAAHLHHGLRGAEADADLELVRAHAQWLGVPLVSARVDARAAMKRERLSGEAGLRTLRRRFLLAAAARARCAAIATAHTADDQLETLLMRLARGSGLQGLGGMRPRHGLWLKPMLEVTREDVEQDLKRAGVGWREDASNASRTYLRNRVRHDVVPALAAASDQPRATLARHAVSAAAEARQGWHTVAAAARRLLDQASPVARPERLDLRAIAARRDPAVRRAALRLWWKRACPASRGLTGAALALLEARLESPTARAALTLERGRKATIRGGWLALDAPKRASGRTSRGGGGKAAPRNAILRRGSPRPASRKSSPAAPVRAADHA